MRYTREWLIGVVVLGVAVSVHAADDFGPSAFDEDGVPTFEDGAAAVAEDGSVIPQEIVITNRRENTLQGLTQEYVESQYERAVETERARGGALGGVGSGLPVELKGFPFELLSSTLDDDQDGLSDADEVRLGTGETVSDTDGDGYADGLEVVRSYNPLIASPADKVSYADPRAAGQLVGGGDYRVTGVRLARSGNQNLLVVTGVAPAHTLVALLVFSEEMRVWVVRADGGGRFLYSSADTLAFGPHEVWAVSTTADGRLRDVSAPLRFVRDAAGVTVLQESPVAVVEESPTPEPNPAAFVGGAMRWLNIVAGTVVAIVLVAIVLVVVIRRRKRRRRVEIPDHDHLAGLSGRAPSGRLDR